MSAIENFSLDHIKSLSQSESKEYLIKYFIPLVDGFHAFCINGTFEIYEAKVIKSTYFNRMSKELNEFYFKHYTSLKNITYKLNEPLIIGNELNLCPNMKAKKTKSFKDYDSKTKEGVYAMLNFIDEVLASNNKKSFEYIINWIANMLKGNKNDSCLYLKGPQGIGKSTLFDFLIDYVIGKLLSYNDGSDPLRTPYNAILGGKLLVVFDELENISSNEWTFISSKLKRYITSTRYCLNEKFIKIKETNNMNNYIINSNNDAIKDDDGRRYFILDVSNKYKENLSYFGKLHAQSFNELVGEAFYTYMLEVDTNNFIPQQFPLTKSKINSFAKRLDKVYEFIKEQFVLKNNDLNHTTKELYNQYVQYCQMQNYRKIDKHSVFEKLEQVGIIYRKTIGNTYFKYSNSELIAIAKKQKWLHELDEFSNAPKKESEIEETSADLENVIEEKNNTIINLQDIIQQQQEEIEKLKLNQKKVIKKKVEPNVSLTIVENNDIALNEQKPKEIEELSIKKKKVVKKSVKKCALIIENEEPDIDLFADL